MKRATPWASTAPIAYSVLCHNCDDNLACPINGSHMWTREDFANSDGQEVECSSCGEKSRIRAPRKLV